MDRKTTLRLVLAFVAGFAILFYLVWSMGVDKITSLLLRVRPEYFLYAAVFYFLTDALCAYALKLALQKRIKLRNILPSHMCGMLYSSVTPGRVGYYYTAFALSKKTSDRRSKNIGILTLMQGISFFVKVVTAMFAIVYFSAYFVSQEATSYVLMASVLPLLFVVLIAVALYTSLLNKLFSKIPVVRGLLGNIVHMQETVREISFRRILDFLAINVFGWFTISAQWYFLSQAMGLDLTYLDALMLQPLLSAVMFFPFTPSGLGVTEGGSALLFTLILSNMSPLEASAAGVAFILLVRVNSIFVDSFGLIDMRIHAHSPSK